MNLITLENISKSYSEKKLLEDISLGINDKEKIGLIGVNGTGKSTLLKIIAGAQIPDDGTITKANKVRIEYLPQNPYYDENATVLEQVFKGTCEAVSYTHLDVYKRQELCSSTCNNPFIISM